MKIFLHPILILIAVVACFNIIAGNHIQSQNSLAKRESNQFKIAKRSDSHELFARSQRYRG